MITVRVRLYRSHDYDLMVLAKTGTIEIANIAKKALEACFLGEEYTVEISDEIKPLPNKLNNSLVTKVRISDEDCPGIEHWYEGFAVGARNNMFKCLIRKAVRYVPIWAYRSDGWVSAEQESEKIKQLMQQMQGTEEVQNDAPEQTENAPKVKAKEKPKKMASSKKKDTAKNSTSDAPESTENVKTINPAPAIDDDRAEKPVSMPQIPIQNTPPDTSTNEDVDDDDDFDAFAAFNALQL